MEGKKAMSLAQSSLMTMLDLTLSNWFRIFYQAKISFLVQPAYSLDLQPCDFNCFGPLKAGVKDKHYVNWMKVETAINNLIFDGLSRSLYQGIIKLPEH